jgi:hypothetical protein
MNTTASSIRHKLFNRTAAVALAIVVGAGAVAGIAYAVGSGSSSTSNTVASATTTTSTPGSVVVQDGMLVNATTKRLRQLGGILRVLGRAVHAEVVVPVSTGGYRTIDLDKGTITSLSSTSITIAPEESGASPVTATITSSTRQPKKVALADGDLVALVSSNGDALLIRHAHAPASAGSASAGSAATSTS